MHALETQGLSVRYGDTSIFADMNLTIDKGKFTALIGSNGCGKSTLLRTMARLLKPYQGTVLLEGASIARLPTKAVAQRMALLPQGPTAPEGLTVLQLVKQGRYPYQSWLQQWSKEDEREVSRALETTGLAGLANRAVDSLSGGQRQRAWIAMVLAQGTDIVLLDEPTTYLDVTHQIEVLDLLYRLNVEEGRTIVAVLHDLNLACRYAHHLVALRDQAVYVQGKPEDVVTSDMIQAVFNLQADVIEDPLYGTPLCVPHGKGRRLGA
ncbi:ABC transporter ATP-binding protein [Paenibacillus pasadenensis]|uniref:ABC-type Fe3+-siderophore transport system, ATPase component n=1 Tax=Paenibacillus pasadenensis TaxID=217090 RepID=A0A2N5N8A8_9BACL|nr:MULTISPECIES: ABC transporter ATP-binding protein [Paenibacillus]PLT46572.1 ABC-type Fe3+-siderophore transport system, ATPase component [Paenibacillus pasadenensis]QGG56967.1 ATP-binding cassette domain-containing protein [Paenibacillus sp. B01]